MKLIYPLAILAAGVTAAYFIFRRKAAKPVEPVPPGPSPAPSPTPAPASDFPIKYGSRGAKVKELQQALGVTADGIFGTNTQNALRSKTGKESIKDAADFAQVLNLLKGISDTSEADKARRNIAELFLQQARVNKLKPLLISYETQGGEFKKSGMQYIYMNRVRVLKKGEKFTDWSAMERDNRGFVIVRLGSQFYKISPYALKFA